MSVTAAVRAPTVESCVACGATDFVSSRLSQYRRCKSCGHEICDEFPESVAIVNDVLDLASVKKRTGLDRFKAKVTLGSTKERGLLVDVGAASGKFLNAMRDSYKRVQGLEITASCLAFCREQLQLDVVDSPNALDLEHASVVTFWHSLEHIPIVHIERFFSLLEERARRRPPVVIISVPNVDSLQYELLGGAWPYADLASHVHQFSSRSLDVLLARYGYQPKSDAFSFSYSSFGYLQGLMNLFNATHNYFYYRKKRGGDFGLSSSRRALLDVYNYGLAAACAAPALGLTVYDALKPQRAGVITRVYSRSGS